MEEALRAALLADTGVAGLTRGVSWVRRPSKGGLPWVLLHLIAAPKDHTMRGLVGLTGHRVQVDCLGKDYASTKALVRAVSAALEALKAAPLQAFLLDERDDDFSQSDGPDSSGAAETFRTIIDVRIWSS